MEKTLLEQALKHLSEYDGLEPVNYKALSEDLKSALAAQSDIHEPEVFEKDLKELNDTYITHILEDLLNPRSASPGPLRRIFWKLFQKFTRFLGWPGMVSWNRQVQFNATLVRMLNKAVIPQQQQLSQQTVFNKKVYQFILAQGLEREKSEKMLVWTEQRIEGLTQGVRDMEKWMQQYERYTQDTQKLMVDNQEFRNYMEREQTRLKDLVNQQKARLFDIVTKLKDLNQDLPESKAQYLRDLAELVQPESIGHEEIDNLLQVGFLRLKMMQTYSGGLAMWPNGDRKSTRLNSSHTDISRMPSSA